ncbi:MAG TPA: glutaminyl-peptide cyclotransferase [Smithellaceae bacterium]|nr:glutaminyl-peptide cyclotransferase [Smithellaceae bacterium]
MMKTVLLRTALAVFVSLLTADLLAAAEKKFHHVAAAPVATVKIVNSFPHDKDAFTEGLLFHQGYFYESTGLQGQSSLRKVEIKSGKIIQEINLAHEYFGEGMTILGNKIYLLTWQNKTVFIYNLRDMQKTGVFHYEGEGWGLTTDGKNLWMSDGGEVITCRHPLSFAIIGKIIVRDGDKPVKNLNELEFVRGEIWANVFMEDVIVRISPRSGKVLGWIDLQPLYSALPAMERRDVLNGIAYDREKNRIFVTGKFWSKVFEIKVIEK